MLAGLDDVIEAAVIGEPDPLMGESVCAFLNVSSDRLDEARVRAWCAERMADYKVPSRVIIDRTPLPRNANGKIQKADLCERAKAFPPLGRRGKGKS